MPFEVRRLGVNREEFQPWFFGRGIIALRPFREGEWIDLKQYQGLYCEE